MLGVLYGLISALSWGSGDFAGGYASRRSNSFQVLAVSALSGLAALAAAAFLRGEAFPPFQGMMWAALGGACGAVGIGAFYRALASGHNASVAPIAAVIGAGLPVVFSALTEGLPGPGQLLGFGLALAGIWMVSTGAHPDLRLSRATLLLTCLAGLGFSLFFIFLAQVDDGFTFTPLVISRSMTFLVAVVMTRLNRLPLPGAALNPLALLTGVLDAGGNLFFLLAQQVTRLDIAVVLSSLYPAATVALAGLVLKEKTTRAQGVGVAICLAAIVLISA